VTGLNLISVKKIKNETSGEVEEYRSIKISEDDENEYFLDVKIPKGYKEIVPQFGDFLTVYRFSKGAPNRYSREGILISKTNSGYDLKVMKNIESYAAWIDSDYCISKGNPLFKNFSYGQEGKTGGFRVKTYLMKYIFPCSQMKAGSICFTGQKEVFVVKIFKPNKTAWTVQYGNLISSIGDNNYEETVQKKLKEGAEIVENCCKIITVKKPMKDLVKQTRIADEQSKKKK